MTEFATCTSVTHHVARKEHKCCECRGIIQPMDVYERTTGVWDSTPHTFKVCGPCEEIRDWLLNETNWPGLEDIHGTFAFGDLKMHLHELVQEHENNQLFPAYRRIVQMKRRCDAAKAKP